MFSFNFGNTIYSDLVIIKKYLEYRVSQKCLSGLNDDDGNIDNNNKTSHKNYKYKKSLDYKIMKNFLDTFKNLKKIKCGNVLINNDEISLFVNFIIEKKIVSLELIKFVPKLLCDVDDYIHFIPSTKMNASMNDINKYFIEELLLNKNNFKHLMTLNISYTGITCHQMIDFLTHNKIVKLNMEGLIIGAYDVFLLDKYLSVDRNLKKIEISFIDFLFPVGANKFTFLKRNTSIHKIILKKHCKFEKYMPLYNEEEEEEDDSGDDDDNGNDDDINDDGNVYQVNECYDKEFFKNTFLKSLVFARSGISDVYIRDILHQIVDVKTLTNIEFDYHDIARVMNVISNFINDSQNITKLKLTNYKCMEPFLNYFDGNDDNNEESNLILRLNKNCKLKTINMKKYYGMNLIIPKLIRHICVFDNLKSLSLHQYDRENKINEMIPFNLLLGLERLKLNAVYLNDDTLKLLAVLLCSSNIITNMKLIDCGINDNNILLINDSLYTCKTLDKINLSYNNLTYFGISTVYLSMINNYPEKIKIHHNKCFEYSKFKVQRWNPIINSRNRKIQKIIYVLLMSIKSVIKNPIPKFLKIKIIRNIYVPFFDPHQYNNIVGVPKYRETTYNKKRKYNK